MQHMFAIEELRNKLQPQMRLCAIALLIKLITFMLIMRALHLELPALYADNFILYNLR